MTSRFADEKRVISGINDMHHRKHKGWSGIARSGTRCRCKGHEWRQTGTFDAGRLQPDLQRKPLGCTGRPGEQFSHLLSPRWFLRRQQTRPVLEALHPEAAYSSGTFFEFLEMSPLKERVRATLSEVAHAADEFGRTTVSGRRLAASLGIREATVSSHLSKARAAGFLITKYRFNNSPVQQLAWPGSGIHPPQPGVSPLTQRQWSDAEVAWWNSLHTCRPIPPPWGSGEPPF